jgi:peptidyl-prolyl cis-trans isomerase SurA
MKKLALALSLLAALSAPAQTLFYYGNDSVSVNDFLYAYHKNNPKNSGEKAFRDYLDLYIASRLKVKEAIALGYDTLPQLVSDLDNLRSQIMPAYINDTEELNRLAAEAFSRSQKDIRLSHIFISFTQNGAYDTTAARAKANEVLSQIKTVPFYDLAKRYSDDPSAKINAGDLGYITVFSLPYELENLAYSTPMGQTSGLHRSAAGYHIFKNVGERKAAGRMKAGHILLAIPPDADEKTKAGLKNLADSIYTRLVKGDDFGKLATAFSNDNISAAANGQMQEFGVGQYDPAFENAAFGLATDGAITRPFLTAHGYHIVKRMGRTPVSAAKDEKTLEDLKNRIAQTDRMKVAQYALAMKVLQQGGFQKLSFRESELWAFTDSLLERKPAGIAFRINQSTPVYSLGQQTFTVNDWLNYAQTFRFKNDGSGLKPYPQVWDEFVQAKAIQHYQAHLENFNPAFRRQLHEFRDGNLFFEIMQKRVWEPSQNDTTALLQYYKAHKQRYQWKQSADAVIFYSSDVAAAKSLAAELKKKPAAWQSLTQSFSEKVAADSGRFELGQIPTASKLPLKAGMVTEPVVNKPDNSAAFAYVLRTYPKPAQRSFNEARGLVITDYQSELEKSWVAELRQKYPVRVNEKALAEVIKNKKY